MSNITDEEIEKLADDYVRIHNLFNRTYIRNTFIDGYKAALQNKVSDISAEGILDKYYKPKMHWKVVNRKNVLAAMHEYASIVNERKDSAGSKSIEDELHPDSEQLLKVCFEELRLKMIKSQKKYGWSNEWLTQDWEDECREQMIEHLQKGDPRDVAVYAMFMIYRGWTTNKKSLVNERKDNVGSWVSVEDRLPDVKKDGNKVLLFREMNESQKALSIGVHDTSMIKYCEKSSYWMPLPEPPESQPQQKEVDGERLIF